MTGDLRYGDRSAFKISQFGGWPSPDRSGPGSLGISLFRLGRWRFDKEVFPHKKPHDNNTDERDCFYRCNGNGLGGLDSTFFGRSGDESELFWGLGLGRKLGLGGLTDRESDALLESPVGVSGEPD